MPIPNSLAIFGLSIRTVSPRILILPESGWYKPKRMHISVDFPAPFSPQQGVDFSLSQRQRDVIVGKNPGKSLADVEHLNDMIHVRTSPRFRTVAATTAQNRSAASLAVFTTALMRMFDLGNTRRHVGDAGDSQDFKAKIARGRSLQARWTCRLRRHRYVAGSGSRRRSHNRGPETPA